MNPARWQEIKSTFDEVLKLEPSLRSRFIQNLAVTDEDLRQRVESLLAEHEHDSNPFLGDPAAGLSIFGDLVGTDPWLGKQIGPYELVRELGSGGMGEVYLARRVDAEFDQTVAIKLIRGGQESAAVISRFKAERQILAGLDHPNIAKLLDGGRTARGQPYFVMEYVPGVPITQYCDMHELGIERRIDLLIQACDGVQHAHQNAIIHRDLKPSNILIVEMDGKPLVRIIDFGLAKTIGAFDGAGTELTKFGIFMGTPGYMSPEQADVRIRNVDTRTDVYSLGVILYVLLTGLQPFEDAGHGLPPFDEWLRRLREEDPAPPSVKYSVNRGSMVDVAVARGTASKQLQSQLRGDLDSITLMSIAREREGRYATPLEFAADLRRYLRHEPVVARPANATYLIGKFMRRHRLATLVGAVVTVLAGIASISGLIAVRKAAEAQFQTAQAVAAQSRLLTQTAAQRLKDADIADANGIILEVLTNPAFSAARSPTAVSVFQDIRAADAQLVVLSGHQSGVTSAVYSPDGSLIATSSADRSARLWDARTGLVLRPLNGHTGSLTSIAFSPDGARVVTASRDKTARIWNVATGTTELVLRGHGDSLYSAAFSPDGTRIVTASYDQTVRIWDASSGTQLRTLGGREGYVYSAAYSFDGARIVTALDDKTARIWNAGTGALQATLRGHTELVSSAIFSPDGTRVLTASADKTARIWDARTGKQLSLLAGHTDYVVAAAYSADGRRIVTASIDKTARIWDAATGAPLGLLSGHRATVYSAGFSPDGLRIVTASRDGTARIWNAEPGSQTAVLVGNADSVNTVAYSHDGRSIVTASDDGTARVWDAATAGQRLILKGHQGRVTDAAYSPDDARIVTTSYDKTARIWDASTGVQIRLLTATGTRLNFAAYAPDGKRLISVGDDKSAHVWDADSGANLGVLRGQSSIDYSAVYSPDGTRIVTASDERVAQVWDAASFARIRVLAGHTDLVKAAAYSPDGNRIVTASDDKTARIWDAHSGAQLKILDGHGDYVLSASYSPNGALIVTGSVDKTARIWDAQSGDQLAAFVGHAGYVGSVAFSPDGRHIATASGDDTARVWNVLIPADLASQLLWDAAAQGDLLSDVDRRQLGIPPDERVLTWPLPASDCDRSAAAFYDPDRRAAGVKLDSIAVDLAKAACATAMEDPSHSARDDYQMGRSLFAAGDLGAARQRFAIAVRKKYSAAAIDLADLENSAGGSAGADAAKSARLYESAWRDGILLGAYKLGQLYEGSATADAGADGGAGIARDSALAWHWYEIGARAGEPYALARCAERDERAALAAPNPSQRDQLLLQAFARYAAAAEGARLQAWPDDAWRYWRHRRASLARLLAKDGMMRQVAEAYRRVVAGK